MSNIQQKIFDEAWLGLGDITKIDIDRNVMIGRSKYDIENPDAHLLKIMTDPKYFGFTVRSLFGIELHPIQVAILQEFWQRPFPMFIASRGFGKSFIMAMYAMLKCMFVPGSKIVIVGSAFRQSKIIFEYMETLWRNSDILRSIFGGASDGPRRDVDRCTLRLGDSWAIAIPLGTGDKIRGLRAHIIIADEFASISPDIYETVVSGFAAVSASPIQNVKAEARKKAMQEAGVWTPEMNSLMVKKSNQAIISGTADYSFKHFAQYWRRYKKIIESQGDPEILEDIFGGPVPENFNWKDYSVIRIPYEMIPKGFMDDKQVARAKATIHSGIYQMEYAACFTSDSEGFFKRSLIESCTCSDKKQIVGKEGTISFDPVVKGDPNKKYIMGVDPASEKDNFSITVIELNGDHRRMVYCWTTNRGNFRDRQKTGLVEDHDFYSFCARKIRNLMKTFNFVTIGVDAQGGGVAIEEALHDPKNLQDGEELIWPVIDYDKSKPTDNQVGLHILELVQFAKADWVSQSNHGLRKDFEDKKLIFPMFDSLSIGLALESEGKSILEADLNPLYDSLSECIVEIEELKNELTTIVMSQTSSGAYARDKWDTPDTKGPHGKKGKLRKDRYSSLLISNMIARQIDLRLADVEYNVIGGSTRDIVKPKDSEMYKGPEWFTGGANDDIYIGINK